MPGFDQTGPLGRGPMTGGGFGYCTGFLGRRAWRPFYGRGVEPWAPGWAGRGRGYRNRFYATGIPFSAYGVGGEPVVEPQEEAAYLKAQAERLRAMLDDVEKRLQNLQGE